METKDVTEDGLIKPYNMLETMVSKLKLPILTDLLPQPANNKEDLSKFLKLKLHQDVLN